MTISFKASREITHADIKSINDVLMKSPIDGCVEQLYLTRDEINEWYNLILGDHGLFIEDYNPKNKTFRNVRRTFGNKGEVVLQVFHDLTDIKFQHEEDGFDDPSPNSVAELIKNNGIRFK
jgi:hypothetical protein